MIIPPQSQEPSDVKKREADAERAAAAAGSADPPPTYTPSSSTAVTDSTSDAGPSSSSNAPPQPPMKPHNFITLSRDNNSIKGHWLLDPSLSVPKSMLPELLKDETEAERRNFNVVSTHGNIDVEVTIAGVKSSQAEGEGVEKKEASKRAKIYVKGRNGNCKLAIHDPPPASSSSSDQPQPEKRLPFKLTIEANHGQVTLYLPRSFHGLLTFINQHGSTKFSSSLSSSVYTFSEMNKTRKCFIGDYSALHDREVEEWEGDEVFVDAKNGGTKVSWGDEAEEKREREGKGKEKGGSFFLKLFGIHRRGHHHGHHHHHHHHHPRGEEGRGRGRGRRGRGRGGGEEEQ